VRQIYYESVVVYNTKKERAWLVPKFNVILYIIRKVLKRTYEGYTEPEIHYRDPESRDWTAPRNEMLRLQDQKIELNSLLTRLEFGHLFNEYSEDLQLAMHQMQ